MTLKKGDFIEIEFTGKIKDTGEIFDSNIPEDLKKTGSEKKPEPFKFALGEKMFLEAIDNFLIGKPEEEKEYALELPPEKAFGKRNPKMIELIPMKIFKQQRVHPVQGMMFNFDGKLAKILSVSGGRVMVDFNNPVAGKDVVYKLKVLRKINDLKEKVDSFNKFLFRKEVPFEIKDKKIFLNLEGQMSQLGKVFKDKYKEIFDMDLEVKEISEKKDKTKEKPDKTSEK
jgi:FKBP-type peptidyl-prolyl cis-trans isomerase 2